jgi:hypothetical protein
MLKELFKKKTTRIGFIMVFSILFVGSFCLWAIILYSEQFTTSEEFLELPKNVYSSVGKFIHTIDHKIRGESEVVQWLWDCPPWEGSWVGYQPTHIYYSSVEEWINAGRNIRGVEQKLIGLYIRNVHPMLIDEIIYALGHLGTEKSVPVLIEILKNKKHNIGTRKLAAGALGAIGNPAAVEPLCSVVASDQEDMSLRYTAIYNLNRIGDPRAIPIIEEFVRNVAQDKRHKDITQQILDELKEKKSKTEELTDAKNQQGQSN